MVENKKKDTYSYKGWLVSDYFLKRAFAVLGHYFVAGLIIWGAVMILIMLIAFFFGIVMGLTSF